MCAVLGSGPCDENYRLRTTYVVRSTNGFLTLETLETSNKNMVPLLALHLPSHHLLCEHDNATLTLYLALLQAERRDGAERQV